MIISNPSKKILYISHGYVGSCHDFNLLKTLFSPEQDWFENHDIHVDLGYLGFDKNYKCANLFIPTKKSKKNLLTDEIKKKNQEKSRQRIYVENAIGGMKRYRCLSDRLRIKDFDFYSDILLVCAGLWNYLL